MVCLATIRRDLEDLVRMRTLLKRQYAKDKLGFFKLVRFVRRNSRTTTHLALSKVKLLFLRCTRLAFIKIRIHHAIARVSLNRAAATKHLALNLDLLAWKASFTEGIRP